MSCGITLREEGSHSSLVGYRFDYRFHAQSAESVFRFDLRKEAHSFALKEARAHVHLGTEAIRIPTILIDPFEVLDYLFYVADPHVGGYL